MRQQNNITQEKLAEYLKISYQAVSKWENDANTPEISLLPRIAEYFNVSLDTLFSENISTVAEVFEEIQDDDIIRVVQLHGKKILKIDKVEPNKSKPIELVFPINSNDKYFKVEVWGSISTSGGINGEVVCHQNITCSEINSYNVQCQGNIEAHVINALNQLSANNINDAYQLKAKAINCSDNINCQQISGDVEFVKNDTTDLIKD